MTHSLPVELADKAFIMPEEISYPGMDGTPIPALLFKSQLPKPGAAVILVHGGPDWFFEMTWYPLMAHMASRGWTVLTPNYRGSTGYGRKWQEASRFDFGGVDTDDVAAGAIFLQREGLCDPKRIAVSGRSHGGYLTASCMTRYPDLWAAGSAFVPFLNWFTNHNEIRPDLQQWDIENFGDPVENYELWKERSPSFFLDRILAPLQLICARHDARCPVSDLIEAEAALRQMGKEVELIIYEDEGHAFLKEKTYWIPKYAGWNSWRNIWAFESDRGRYVPFIRSGHTRNRIHPSSQPTHLKRNGRDFKRVPLPGNPDRGRGARIGATSLFPARSCREVYRRGRQAYNHPGQGRHGQSFGRWLPVFP